MPEQTQLTELFKRSFREMMKDVGTSIVGHVLAFDSETQLAQVQIGIERIDIDGKTFTPPPLIEVPVYFSGGDFLVEHQVDAGTEGMILFSQRCIDAWVNEGGVAKNPILRFHDFSDAVFFCGVRSQPNKVEGFANDGIRLRNKDASSYVWLKSDGTIEIKGNVTVVGSLTPTSLSVGGVDFSTHKHGGVTSGGSQTGTPV